MSIITPPPGVTPPLLLRIRARQGRSCGDGPDFAPLPCPAHDRLAEVVSFVYGRGPEPPWWDAPDPLQATLLHAVLLAEHARGMAEQTGIPLHRQFAEQALALALEWARELVRVLPARDGEGPAPAPPGRRGGGAP